MRGKITLIMSFLAVFITAARAQTDPFGIPDTLRIANLEIGPNSAASIPVYLYNDENLMGVTIPLIVKGDSSYVSIDSILFNQRRIADCQFINENIDNDAKSLLIGIIPSFDTSRLFLTPGNDLLFDIYISTRDFQNDAVCTIGSSQLPPFNDLKFVGDSITPFVPVFIPGTISLNHNLSVTEDDRIFSNLYLLAYPNPSNSGLNLTITLPHSGIIRLTIYNILGQEIVSELFAGIAGVNNLKVLNTSSWASGIYLIRADSGSRGSVTRILLLK